jgi:hypothetical protein
MAFSTVLELQRANKDDSNIPNMQTHKNKLYMQSCTQWVFVEQKTLSTQAMVKCCILGSSCTKKKKKN